MPPEERWLDWGKPAVAFLTEGLEPPVFEAIHDMGLLALDIAGIAAVVSLGIVLGIAEMSVHLRIKRPLDDLLLELGKQPRLAPKCFRTFVVLQKVINQPFLCLRVHGIPFQLSSISPFHDHLHSLFQTLVKLL